MRPRVATLSEASGILLRLSELKAEDAVAFLRTLSQPGIRFIDGKIVYSAAFLEADDTTNQERLGI